MSNKEKILINIIQKILKKKIAITKNSFFKDIKGYDSLIHVQIVLKIEQKFLIKLNNNQINKIKKPFDFLKHIK